MRLRSKRYTNNGYYKTLGTMETDDEEDSEEEDDENDDGDDDMEAVEGERMCFLLYYRRLADI
ncbi:hypothetical protein McanCB56680_003890 [Microsporum canis]